MIFQVIYLVKYLNGFRYFILHDIKFQFKNAATLNKPNTLGYTNYRIGGLSGGDVDQWGSGCAICSKVNVASISYLVL